MSGNGNPGVNKLGLVLQERMKTCGESSLLLDFGAIQTDMSLLTNTFPIPIPKTDYTVCRQLTLGATGEALTATAVGGKHSHGPSGEHAQESGTGSHSHTDEGEHGHSVLIPEKMRKLKPGDRVLVAWVQNEAVVVDIILPAASI
ncbi:MAG: hypothetical protein EOM14_02610 [Clostridia bacterium]|nr:hypothetical protein [Clostridia bacterium]